MKVVLFCGGEGTRIREYSESIPKPMVPVGYRPILWHVMKYYAYYGHRDFILALGYKADVIKDFFLNYNEAVSNDFVLYEGGKRIELVNSDIEDWTITFVDTGAKACIGERLWRVRSYLEGEDMFLANYSDGVTEIRATKRLIIDAEGFIVDYNRAAGGNCRHALELPDIKAVVLAVAHQDVEFIAAFGITPGDAAHERCGNGGSHGRGRDAQLGHLDSIENHPYFGLLIVHGEVHLRHFGPGTQLVPQ